MAAAPRKSYPLRADAALMAAMQAWADDELRSVNAQIEYVLRDALRAAGRLSAAPAGAGEAGADEPFLVTRPSSDSEGEDEDLFPIRRAPE